MGNLLDAVDCLDAGITTLLAWSHVQPSCVTSSALFDLRAACGLAVVARPLVGVQGRRTPGAASRGRRDAQSQPETSDGLGARAGVRRVVVIPQLTLTVLTDYVCQQTSSERGSCAQTRRLVIGRRG